MPQYFFFAHRLLWLFGDWDKFIIVIMHEWWWMASTAPPLYIWTQVKTTWIPSGDWTGSGQWVPDGSAAADELGQRRRLGRVLYAPWDVRTVTGGGRGVVAEDGDVQDVAAHFLNRRPRRGRRRGWNRWRGRSGWLEAAVNAENGDVQHQAGHRRRRSSTPQPTRDDPDQPPPDRRAPGLIDQRVSGGRLDRSTGRPSFIFFLLTCIVLPQKKN